MHKGLKLNNDIDISNLNNYKIEAENKIVAKKVSEVSNYFKSLTDKDVIDITESGKYYISEVDSSKYLDVNIENNIEVELYFYNSNKDQYVENLNINVSNNSSAYVLLVDELVNAQSVRKANVSENAEISFNIASFNTSETSNLVEINLNEESAKGELKVISLVKGNTFNKYETVVNNFAPKTDGLIWQKAVALDGGRNEFLASGHIAKGCDEAKNFQESRVLLLDNAASGDASPLLLIDHFNVEAGHAAGVSRVNEDELYYLQSRGIDKNEAEHLITLAFVKPLIDEIRDEEIQEYVIKLVKKIVEVE